MNLDKNRKIILYTGLGVFAGIVALVVLLLFGGRKIPELMKGIGKGVRSFKEGMNNIEKEIENPDQEKK